MNIETNNKQFDFIKGIAIISVILLHAGISLKYFSTYWIGQAVPLFIIIICLLGCMTLSKNNSIRDYFRKENIEKMLMRIFKPFILAQILIVVIYIARNDFSIKSFLAGGGIGPGSNYPWVYLQLWILIPFMYLLMKRNPIIGCFLIILITVGTNIVFSILSSSNLFHISFLEGKTRQAFVLLYGLCVNRYLFIFPLAFLLMEYKLKYNYLLLLVLVGAGFIYCIDYKNINMEPIFYNSGWQAQEFPGDFYTILVFICLYKIYNYIPNIAQEIISKIGKNSWGIFNMQMIYFSFNSYLNINKYLNLILALFICIIPVYTITLWKNKKG
jgi:hypothetical protein